MTRPSTIDDTTTAAQRLSAVVPIWSRTGRARELIGLGADQLLHAGPPLPSVDRIPTPMLNSACAALVFENRAPGYNEARDLILGESVQLLPAQDRQVVTPLAAVVSGSMWLHQVEDADDGRLRGYAPINEGSGPAQRAGQFNAEVVARLHFIHEVIGPALADVATRRLDLLALAAGGLANGDDLHARVGYPSAAMARDLQSSGLSPEVLDFLHTNPHGFLNLWMAACRCMLAAARTGSGQLLVAAGGNGVEFGIQLSSRPGQWLSAPAQVPLGPALAENLAGHPRLPAIGDSAVIDAVGFGAFALDAAPAFSELLDRTLVADMELCRHQYLIAEHPLLGRPLGLDASRVIPERLPGVCLAALDPSGALGLVGRGIARHPAALYPT